MTVPSEGMNDTHTATHTHIIGDIHGCADLLDRLMDTLSPSADDALVFLGDYIDRGPDTPGVVNRLIALKEEHARTVFLRGNHEAMLLNFIGKEDHGHGDAYHLTSNGGIQTLLQYGVPQERVMPFKDDNRPPDRHITAHFTSFIPDTHVAFLEETRLMYATDEVLCVHAGIRPGVPLEEQVEEDVLWIRDPFLTRPHGRDETVVYGHTPTYECGFMPRIESEEKRIGLDTGAVYGGALTALTLPDMSFTQCPAE